MESISQGVIEEMRSFGIKKIADLSSLFSQDSINTIKRAVKETDMEGVNRIPIVGLLRIAMIKSNPKKYFEETKLIWWAINNSGYNILLKVLDISKETFDNMLSTAELRACCHGTDKDQVRILLLKNPQAGEASRRVRCHLAPHHLRPGTPPPASPTNAGATACWWTRTARRCGCTPPSFPASGNRCAALGSWPGWISVSAVCPQGEQRHGRIGLPTERHLDTGSGVACGDGRRPALTQAARDGLDERGRDGETAPGRTEKRRRDQRGGNPGLHFRFEGTWGSYQPAE
jgi:hypothetical protein